MGVEQVNRNATFGAVKRKLDRIERKLDSLLIDPETASEEEIRRHKERVLREAKTPTPPEERAKIVDHDGRTIYP